MATATLTVFLAGAPARYPRRTALALVAALAAGACAAPRASHPPAPPRAAAATRARQTPPTRPPEVLDAAAPRPPDCFDEAQVRRALDCRPGSPSGSSGPPTRSPIAAAQGDGSRSLSPRPLTESEQQRVAERVAYACDVRPPSGPPAADAAHAGAPAPDARAQAVYEIARVYYQARQLDRAAVLFRDVALADPPPSDDELGTWAATLYLDALNVMASQWNPPRLACYERMEADIPQLRARLCSARAASRREAVCQTLQTLGCQLAVRRAEALHQEEAHTQAAEVYLSVAARPECARAATSIVPEALYNAAVAFDAAGLNAEATRAREALVRDHLHRGHPLARRAADELRSSGPRGVVNRDAG